jgi:hypothetical protein
LDRQEQRRRAPANRSRYGINDRGVGQEKTRTSKPDCYARSVGDSGWAGLAFTRSGRIAGRESAACAAGNSTRPAKVTGCFAGACDNKAKPVARKNTVKHFDLNFADEDVDFARQR